MHSKSICLFILVATGIGHALKKTCIKENQQTFQSWRMDPIAKELKAVIQTVRRKSCCTGYIEVGRRVTRVLCEPVCPSHCHGGYCNPNDQCVCYEGYKFLGKRGCKRQTTSTSTVPSTTTSTTTTMRPTITMTTMPTTTPTTTMTTSTTTSTTTTMPTTALTTRTTPTTTTTPTTIPTIASTTTSTAISTKTTMPKTTSTTTTTPTTTSTTTYRTTSTIAATPEAAMINTTTSTTVVPSQERSFTTRISTDIQDTQQKAAIPAEHKPMSFDSETKSATGAEHMKNLECENNVNCACSAGYTLDSQLSKCRPLCNGKIYGCIGGTCIGINQCRCDEGTHLAAGELFHCEAVHPYWKWALLLLLIPAGLIVVSLAIAIRRWRTARANRLKATGEGFSVVRFNESSDHDGELSLAECSTQQPTRKS